MSLATGYQKLSPSEAVIETVAAREGVDPIELDAPLYEAINPEALDALVETAAEDGNRPVRVEFTYLDYRIVVDGADQVTVAKRGPDTEPPSAVSS